MALIKAARQAQYPQSADFRFTVADTMANVAGVVQALKSVGSFEAIPLPIGAVVVGGELVVETASNDSGATVTVAVGDSLVANRYLAATSIKAAGRTALALTGFKGAGENIRFDIAGAAGDATAGSFYLRVEYVIDGRMHEVVIA